MHVHTSTRAWSESGLVPIHSFYHSPLPVHGGGIEFQHPGNRGDLFRCENSSLFIIREWIRPMIDYPTQCNQELRAWQGQTACGQVELLDPLRVARATYSVASLLLHGGRECAPNMTTDPAWAARTMSIWFTLEEWSIYPAIQPKHWSNWLII